MDCVFFDVLMVDRTESLLVEVPGYLYLEIQMNGRSGRQRMAVVYYLNVEVHGIQGKRQVSHAVESVGRQSQRNREMNHAQSGRRVGETFHDNHSDGRYHESDALLDRDIERDLGFGLGLDLYACPDHDYEDRGLGRRSTGLSVTDSCGTQP